MSFSDLVQRRPTILAAPRYGLYLRFQINPNEISFVKDPQYSTRSVPGWHAPLRWWTQGSEEIITFTSFFDSSRSSRSGGTTLPIPPTFGLGLRGVSAVINSFIRPKKALDFAGSVELRESIRDLFGPRAEFLPPPDAYFVYGSRIWRVHVLSATIQEIAHDRNLNPTQMEVAFRLGSIEIGSTFRIRDKEREGLALATSALAEVGRIPGLTEFPANVLP